MEDSEDFLFKVDSYLGKKLAAEDENIIQKLLERCANFFYFMTGLPLPPSAVSDLLKALPEGKDARDKLVIGVFEKQQHLIGIINIIKNFQEPRDWYVKLMLLEPEQRGKGIGTKVYKAFEQWALESGAKQILLSVVEENERAYRFWRKRGFEMVKKLPPEKFGNKELVRFAMRRYLV